MPANPQPAPSRGTARAGTRARAWPRRGAGPRVGKGTHRPVDEVAAAGGEARGRRWSKPRPPVEEGALRRARRWRKPRFVAAAGGEAHGSRWSKQRLPVEEASSARSRRRLETEREEEATPAVLGEARRRDMPRSAPVTLAPRSAPRSVALRRLPSKPGPLAPTPWVHKSI